LYGQLCYLRYETTTIATTTTVTTTQRESNSNVCKGARKAEHEKIPTTQDGCCDRCGRERDSKRAGGNN